MNLGELSISIRERSVAEVFDLAILVCRKYCCQLLSLALISMTPWIALNMFLFLYTTNSDEAHSGAMQILIYAIILAEIPIMTAAITLFLGNVLFDGNISLRYCLGQAWKRSFQLLLYGCMRPLLFLSPAHQCEVIMLEQLTGSQARKRGFRLLSGWRNDYLGHLCLSVIICYLCMCTAAVLIDNCIAIFTHAQSPIINVNDFLTSSFYMMSFQDSILSYICLIPLLIYFTVVRFLSYINLRTVREGWSTELHLKNAAQKQYGAQS